MSEKYNLTPNGEETERARQVVEQFVKGRYGDVSKYYMPGDNFSALAYNKTVNNAYNEIIDQLSKELASEEAWGWRSWDNTKPLQSDPRYTMRIYKNEDANVWPEHTTSLILPGNERVFTAPDHPYSYDTGQRITLKDFIQNGLPSGYGVDKNEYAKSNNLYFGDYNNWFLRDVNSPDAYLNSKALNYLPLTFAEYLHNPKLSYWKDLRESRDAAYNKELQKQAKEQEQKSEQHNTHVSFNEPGASVYYGGEAKFEDPVYGGGLNSINQRMMRIAQNARRPLMDTGNWFEKTYDVWRRGMEENPGLNFATYFVPYVGQAQFVGDLVDTNARGEEITPLDYAMATVPIGGAIGKVGKGVGKLLNGVDYGKRFMQATENGARAVRDIVSTLPKYPRAALEFAERHKAPLILGAAGTLTGATAFADSMDPNNPNAAYYESDGGKGFWHRLGNGLLAAAVPTAMGFLPWFLNSRAKAKVNRPELERQAQIKINTRPDLELPEFKLTTTTTRNLDEFHAANKAPEAPTRYVYVDGNGERHFRGEATFTPERLPDRSTLPSTSRVPANGRWENDFTITQDQFKDLLNSSVGGKIKIEVKNVDIPIDPVTGNPIAAAESPIIIEIDTAGYGKLRKTKTGDYYSDDLQRYYNKFQNDLQTKINNLPEIQFSNDYFNINQRNLTNAENVERINRQAEREVYEPAEEKYSREKSQYETGEQAAKDRDLKEAYEIDKEQYLKDAEEVVQKYAKDHYKESPDSSTPPKKVKLTKPDGNTETVKIEFPKGMVEKEQNDYLQELIDESLKKLKWYHKYPYNWNKKGKYIPAIIGGGVGLSSGYTAYSDNDGKQPDNTGLKNSDMSSPVQFIKDTSDPFTIKENNAVKIYTNQNDD